MEYFLKTNRLGFSNWTDDKLNDAITLWADNKVTKYIGGDLSLDILKID